MHLRSVCFYVYPSSDSSKKNNAGDSFIPDLHNSENFAARLSRDQLGKVSYQTCCKTGEKRDATYFCKYFTNFVELSEFEGWNQMKFIALWNLRTCNFLLNIYLIFLTHNFINLFLGFE